MKATIDREGCISCGLCVNTCPEVFEMADDGIAAVKIESVPEELLNSAQEARDACPVSVISIE